MSSLSVSSSSSPSADKTVAAALFVTSVRPLQPPRRRTPRAGAPLDFLDRRWAWSLDSFHWYAAAEAAATAANDSTADSLPHTEHKRGSMRPKGWLHEAMTRPHNGRRRGANEQGTKIAAPSLSEVDLFMSLAVTHCPLDQSFRYICKYYRHAGKGEG